MQIALIHLSDIHLRTDRRNVVFHSDEAVGRVVDAVRSQLSAHAPAACFFLITGDIAYHGTEPEYALARVVLKKIFDGVQSFLGEIRSHLVMVPGNHDCDFVTAYPEIAARGRILNTEGLENISAFEADIMASVQAPYRAFQASMLSDPNSRTVSSIGPCVEVHDFEVGEPKEIVRFYLLNTAWMSQEKEKQGLLVLPTAGLAEPRNRPTPTVALVLQHHPRAWLRASNAREVTRRLEGLADLILTGHEHESDDADVNRHTGAQISYIEGYALQSDATPAGSSSAFKVIVLDTSAGSQITYDLVMGPDEVYLPVSHTPLARPLSRNPRRLENTFTWNEKGSEFVADIGLPISHERRDRVSLDELFVYPYVREMSRATSEAGRKGRVSAENVEWLGKRVFFVGGELCGKTTLAKKLFADARQKVDSVPIYIRGINLRKGTPKDCRSLIDSAFEVHYENDVEKFRQLPRERKVLVIDDLHRSSLRGPALATAMRWFQEQFGSIIVLADNLLMLDEAVGSGDCILDHFTQYEFLPMGHVKRDELVQRWCNLGEASSNAAQVKRRAARALQQVNSIMGKRFVPHVPLFVIGILQQIEMTATGENFSASQGAVFEALATLKLQASFKDDLLTAKNYLAHLAFALHERRQRFMSFAEFENWHERYNRDLKLRLNGAEMLKRLEDAQLLQTIDNEVGFRHRFGYYLFVADYFARHMEEEATRQRVAAMYREVFHEETANILVFLCFKAAGHTEFIVQSMLEAAASVFRNEKPATFEEDATALGKLIASSPPLELAALGPSERRAQMLASSEEAGELNAYGSIHDDDLGRESEAELSYPPEVKEVYAAIRTIQIMGQILRNFSGSLGGTQKVEIARATYELSMRVTGWYFSFITVHHKVVVEEMARLISKDRPSVARDNQRLADEVRGVVVGLTELVASSMVKRAAEATAMNALAPVFSEVLRPTEAPRVPLSYSLIWFELTLNLNLGSSVGAVRAMAKELKGNPYAFRILQHLGWMYLHINYIDVQETQQICEALEIKTPLLDTAIKHLPAPK